MLDIWKHTERKLQSFDWEKDQKSKAKMSPKILQEKNEERENRKEVGEEKKKVMAALLVFMLTALEIFF